MIRSNANVVGGAVCAAVCLTITTSLHGAGFALQEHSVSGLGNAFAGGAASAEDASTVYFNPAGMARIDKPQLHAGAHFLLPEARFRNEGTTTLGVPTQGSDDASSEEAILPNLFYAGRFSDDLAFGIGISAPFGLTTRYEDDWVGRYIARETKLETVAVNPSFAYRINDKLSAGAGVSFVKAEAKLSNAIDFGLVFLNQLQSGAIPVNSQTMAIAQDVQANLGGTKYDGGMELEGDGDGWGYNVGFLYEQSESLRFGIHYRSSVSIGLNGQADFTVGALEGTFGAAFADQGGQVDIELPATLSASVFADVNERLSLMADITRTWWSDFHDLTIRFENPSPPTIVIPELWKNVNKYSVGASYKFNDTITGRFGLAYDETPVPDSAHRSPRIPDADRFWVTAGVSVKVTDAIDCHFGYLHIFIDDPAIDNATHAAGQRLVGTIDATVDLLSFGTTVRF